jgi:hypothetical protein
LLKVGKAARPGWGVQFDPGTADRDAATKDLHLVDHGLAPKFDEASGFK